MRQSPAKVVWIYAQEDKKLATDFLRFSAVLEQVGMIQNWTPDHIRPGQPWRQIIEAHLQSADVIMLLISADLFNDGLHLWENVYKLAQANDHIRLVPVILRSSLLPPELEAYQRLPRSGKAIAAMSDRDAGILEVIQGLQEIIRFRPSPKTAPEAPSRGATLTVNSADGDGQAERGFHTRGAAPSLFLGLGETLETIESEETDLTINDIFRLDGPPHLTFVEPSQFNDLKLELRTMGTGLIVEGPSKIGKTTAIKKALENLGIPETQQRWYQGQSPPPFEAFESELHQLVARKEKSYLFIDDFHYLHEERYRRALAFTIKTLADQDRRFAKITLIGINPLGSSLVQVMPDLAGRYRVMHMMPQHDLSHSLKIAELIMQGERAANIRYSRREEFVIAAGGSFYVAQLLCNFAARKARCYEPMPSTLTITFGPADVEQTLGRELAARFRDPLLAFAAFDQKPPPRGASLSLLWLLSRNRDGMVTLNEARLRFPMLTAVFDWFADGNLCRCCQEIAGLKGLLFYHSATLTLTMEDPQLRFYLTCLDWEAFARASGHGSVQFHKEDGPNWMAVSPGRAKPTLRASSATNTDNDQAPNIEGGRILHLSDLHFSTEDEAMLSYSMLADDLRAQEINQLDALIISGDLVQRAEPKEYDAVHAFLNPLMDRFQIAQKHLVIVPGNHDINWTCSDEAYKMTKRKPNEPYPAKGTYVEHSPSALEIRDEQLYPKRLQAFADFYQQVTGEGYPLDIKEQATVKHLPHLDACVLGLNSSWEIDHHFRERASINPSALAHGLTQIQDKGKQRLRIAVFHHPVYGEEDAQIEDRSFLQRLAVNDFQLVLHGHIHKADLQTYPYEHIEDGQKINILSVGTFGAPPREWVPGYPLQYSLIFVGQDHLTIKSRCRREINGAWEADARWRRNKNQDPSSSLRLKL